MTIACSLSIFTWLYRRVALCEVCQLTPDHDTSAPLRRSLRNHPTLPSAGRVFSAPINTHAIGGGSVQLGSIRNPD